MVYNIIKKQSKMIRPPLPADLLFDLETRLAEPAFLGIPIGSTLGDLYTIKLHNGNISLRVRDVIRTRMHHEYRRLCPIWQSVPRQCPKHRRVLATWLGNNERLNQLVLPVFDRVSPENCLVVGMTRNMRSALDTRADFIVWDECVVNRNAWRKEYARCAPLWHRTIQEWLEEYGITKRLFPILKQAVLIQSQKVMACDWLLNTVRPDVVLTEYDRNSNAACLVLAAKVRHIPTVTLVHGTINPPYGYTPLLADVACCWGEQHREQFLSLGTPQERLTVTGCPRLTQALRVSGEDAKRKAGVPAEQSVVMLASNPVSETERRSFVNAFAQAMARCPNFTGVVRLHPSEKLAFYAAERQKFPKLVFSLNTELTLDEALAAADLVVTHNSGLGNDALIKGRLTVIFDVLDTPLMNGQALAEKAGCPRVRTSGELASTVVRILTDSNYRASLHQQAARYANWFCAAYGDDAAQAIAKVLRERFQASSDA